MQNIEKVDSYNTARDNYKTFGYYANSTRALASEVDGLKVVYRRMLWTAMQQSKGHYVKSAVISGATMKLHPHGEQSDVLYSLVNSKLQMFDKQGNFGSKLIAGSAPRYTECRYNKMAELYLGQDLLNYCEMVEGEIGYMEPKYLSTLIPFILVDGNSSMGIGISSSIPSLDILDLAKFYRSGLTKNSSKTMKLDIGNCKIISSVEDISKDVISGKITGFRFGINSEIEGSSIVISDLPPGMNFSRVEKIFLDDIDKEYIDFRDESNANMRYVFDIVKGNLAEYINKLNDLTSTVSYDLVMTGSYDDSGKVIYTSLNKMRDKSLNYLRECARRKFSTEIQKLSKKLGMLKVIKYLKDNDLVKDLPKLTVNDIKSKLPFKSDDVESALQLSISKLTKSVSDEDLVSLEKSIKELELNKSNPDNYIIKLYDDFINELSKIYINKTKYVENNKSEVDLSYDVVVDGNTLSVKLVSTEVKKDYVILLYPTGWIRVIKLDKPYSQSIKGYVGYTKVNKDDNIIIACDEGKLATVFKVNKLVDMKEGYILTTKHAEYIGCIGQTFKLDNGKEVKSDNFTYPRKASPWDIYSRFESSVKYDDEYFVKF